MSAENCQYLTQPGNKECGQPATLRYPTSGGRWLVVCPEHGREAFNRSKKTGRPVNPTPLVKVIMAQKSMRPAPAPVAPVFKPVIPTVAVKSISEQIREWRESQSEGSDQP
jgi:hypothetical protein